MYWCQKVKTISINEILASSFPIDLKDLQKQTTYFFVHSDLLVNNKSVCQTNLSQGYVDSQCQLFYNVFTKRVLNIFGDFCSINY